MFTFFLKNNKVSIAYNIQHLGNFLGCYNALIVHYQKFWEADICIIKYCCMAFTGSPGSVNPMLAVTVTVTQLNSHHFFILLFCISPFLCVTSQFRQPTVFFM